MRRRPRALLAAFVVVGGATACNAILGIHDLTEPPDGDSGAAEAAAPDAPGTIDAATDGGCATCVIELQEGGAIYPTWPITSDLFILNFSGVVPPTNPTYVDAGAGTLVETHTGLTWVTSPLRGDAGTGVTFDEAVAECKKLGPDWRMPTRIELATTQFREELDASQYLRDRCIPPSFELPAYPYTWTSTPVPGKDGGEYYIEDEAHCAYLANAPTEVLAVRCVKGATKPAHFEIVPSRNTVHAIETNLEWERVGVVVSSFSAAKAHCDSIAMRVPIIQELYGIIDTRTLQLTDARIFPLPAPVVQGFLSQTVYGYEDGGAHYAVVGGSEGTRGWEDTLPPTGASSERLLVRCVREFIP